MTSSFDDSADGMIDSALMFEPKQSARENLVNYIGARVTDTEEAWLRTEMKRRKLSMSDLIRTALGSLHSIPRGK